MKTNELNSEKSENATTGNPVLELLLGIFIFSAILIIVAFIA